MKTQTKVDREEKARCSLILSPKEVAMQGRSLRLSLVYCLLSIVFILLFSVSLARADVMLGEDNFNSHPTDWTKEYSWSSISDPVTGGVGDSGWLRVTFPATANPEAAGDDWYNIVHMPAQNLFAGAWTNASWVEFDFWASNYSPTRLQVQWKATTNANIWGYVLNPTSNTNQWDHYTAPLNNVDDWHYTGGTLDQYLSDLNSIEWIGVYIWRNTGDEQIYGIDNYQLWIPEPAELSLLAAAIITTISTIRRRRRDKKETSGGSAGSG